MSIPQEQIDPDAAKVVRRLTKGGFTAYLVGGCVRDLLLGRKPKDFDIATSATPPEIKALFRNCRIIGRRFRLAHIFFGQKIIETSTFRANPREVLGDEHEGEGVEGGALEETELSAAAQRELLIRRDNVFGTAEEDARRRDFTINGLFYELDADRVIDYVEGLPDLERRLVRTIGDPDIRFREDPVRILRAIKFAARLGFGIDRQTYAAILAHRGEIAKCAPPRVLEEIYRLLRGGAARRSFELLDETEVLEVLIPPLSAALHGSTVACDRLNATLEGLDVMVQEGEAPSNALLAAVLAAPLLHDVLHDAGPGRGDAAQQIWEGARPILEAMRVSRRDTEVVRQMLLAQRRFAPSRRKRVRPMALVRRDWFGEALALFELAHPSPEGEIAEEIARWHRLAQGGRGAPHGESESESEGGEVAEGAGGEAPGRKRRRRRGGRRRRRRGGPDQPPDQAA